MTAVFRVAPTVALGFPLVGTASCITQDLQFIPPENFPPSIEAHGAYPLDQLIRVRADRLGISGDAGTETTRVDLEYVVRDPDVDQELQYKLYVDYQRGVIDDPVQADFIPPRLTGDRRRREPPPLNVPVFAIREPGCHRVELLVSERFQQRSADATGREPLTEGDLGTAVWWVATQATEGDAVDMTVCP